MPIPINRVVAFAGPYISIVAGALAAWLVARANVLGVPGLDERNLATDISAALSFVLVAVLSWLGSAKWLAGHRIAMQGDALVAAAALAAPVAVAVPVAASSDEEAFAAATLTRLAPGEQPSRMDDEDGDPATGPAVPEAGDGAFEQAIRDELLLAGALDTAPESPGEAVPDTVVDDALASEDDLAPALPDEEPADGTPDELRVLMPSEAPLEGEPDEDEEP